MNSFGTENGHETSVREKGPGLNVLLMYEDFSTGLRARQLLDAVVNSVDLEVDFRAKLWRFDLLREPALLRRATDEAAKADMVFLSAHGRNDLPAAVHSWFKRWLERKGSEPCALAVALDPDTEHCPTRNRVLAALGTVARPAGVDVFVQAAEAPQTKWESAVQDIQQRAETQTELLEEILHRTEWSSYRESGINE